MQAHFEFSFSGRSLDGNNYDCKMIISGDTGAIGKLLSDYAIAECKNGHNEPMQILIACFEQMQKQTPEGKGRIINPNFSRS